MEVKKCYNSEKIIKGNANITNEVIKLIFREIIVERRIR